MNSSNPIDVELACKTVKWWLDSAVASGIDVSGFFHNATLENRIAWAKANGLEIGTTYARSATNLKVSVENQIRETIQWSAKSGAYIPPEYVSVDEASCGNQSKRPGIVRMKSIIRKGTAVVLVVYDLNRLFRKGGSVIQFLDEEVSSSCLRLICLLNGIDSDDERYGKLYRILDLRDLN